jgi:ABC-type transport system involved in multi-copper enzyme maturation permease subunit
MGDVFYAEALKLKRSVAFVFLAIGAFIPPIANSLYPMKFNVMSFTLSSFLFLNLSCFVVGTALAGYVFSREFEDKTMSALLCCPIPRIKVLFAKFLIVVLLIAGMCLLSAAIAILCLFIKAGSIPLSADYWISFVKMVSGLVLIHISLSPAAIALAIVTGRTTAPVLLGLFNLVAYATFIFTKIGNFVPFSIPSLFLMNTAGLNLYEIPFTFSLRIACFVLFVYFILSSALAFFAIRRRETIGPRES